jgi:hypothetical protein
VGLPNVGHLLVSTVSYRMVSLPYNPICSDCLPLPPLEPPAVTALVTVLAVWLLPGCQILGIMGHSLSDWLLPFINMHLRILHVFSLVEF